MKIRFFKEDEHNTLTYKHVIATNIDIDAQKNKVVWDDASVKQSLKAWAKVKMESDDDEN